MTRACRGHQDGGVGRASVPKNSSDTANSNCRRLDAYQKLREEVVLCAEARGYVAPKLGQVAKAREDRNDPMDVGGFGQWKGRPTSKGKGKLAKGKEQEKTVQSHQDNRTRKRFKVSVELWENRSPIEGLLGKATAATEPRTNKFFWNGKRCERQVRQRWRKERQIQRCWST